MLAALNWNHMERHQNRTCSALKRSKQQRYSQERDRFQYVMLKLSFSNLSIKKHHKIGFLYHRAQKTGFFSLIYILEVLFYLRKVSANLILRNIPRTGLFSRALAQNEIKCQKL